MLQHQRSVQSIVFVMVSVNCNDSEIQCSKAQLGRFAWHPLRRRPKPNGRALRP